MLQLLLQHLLPWRPVLLSLILHPLAFSPFLVLYETVGDKTLSGCLYGLVTVALKACMPSRSLVTWVLLVQERNVKFSAP